MAVDEEAEAAAALPLAGVVLCCTAIVAEERTLLANKAAQMGACHKLDLTSDVTHLIVGDLDTPKYRFVAKERPDVHCLLPAWVEAVRVRWLEGGAVDVPALQRQHRLPTFAGLRICLTGFEDLEQRRQIEETVTANGATYHGDLTRNVTHLIAHRTSGAKYTFAKSWGLRVVAIEWLLQSLERGMVLDEALYDPALDPSERGKGAWIRHVPARRSPTRATARKRPLQEPAGVGGPPRKLRRTASAKFEGQTEALWTDIVQGGAAAREQWPAQWDEAEVATQDGTAVPLKTEQTDSSSIDDLALAEEPVPPKGLFHGKAFYLHGFDLKKVSVLEKHLRSNEAEIVHDVSQLTRISDDESGAASSTVTLQNSTTYVLVPHAISPDDVPPLQHLAQQPVLVTDLWLERCLFQKSIVLLDANPASSPFRYPIAGFEKLTICSTGFEGVDLLHLSKVIPLLGAKYDGALTPNISVLLCNASAGADATNDAPFASSEKVQHAIKWNIPVVSIDWLWSCMRTTKHRSLGPFLVRKDMQARRGARKFTSSEGSEPRDDATPAARFAMMEDKAEESVASRSQLGNEGKTEQHAQSIAGAGDDMSFKMSSQQRSTRAFLEAGSESQDRLESDADAGIGRQRRSHGKSSQTGRPNKVNSQAIGIRRSTANAVMTECMTNTFELSHPHGSAPPLQAKASIVREQSGGLLVSTSFKQAIPLQEISPNSPPKHLRSPIKGGSMVLPELKGSFLSDTISALLASHKRAASQSAQALNPSTPGSGGGAGGGNRGGKRRLFGRAPSNLSARSNSAIAVTTATTAAGFSRASSVDTLNTDGVGTPIEANAPTLSRQTTGAGRTASVTVAGGGVSSAMAAGAAAALMAERDALTASLLATYDEHALAAAEDDDEANAPPRTQLGYEDPEAGVHRERLLRKMKVDGAAAMPVPLLTPERTSSGLRERQRRIGSLRDKDESVSRRTRLADAKTA